MSGALDGRRVLVVGAGTRSIDDPDAPVGNGRAIAVVAGRAGAIVACADLDGEAARFTAALVEAEGATAHVLEGDVTDAATCSAAALEVMPGGGAIVVISSIAGLTPGSRIPAYDASKAALTGLCRQVAAEGARKGIRANVVAPGLIDTPLGRLATGGRPSRAKAPVPLGRQGTAWEVAEPVVFLLSDAASYITSQLLAVDGGLTGARG